jgi:hypothetical protein
MNCDCVHDGDPGEIPQTLKNLRLSARMKVGFSSIVAHILLNHDFFCQQQARAIDAACRERARQEELSGPWWFCHARI